MSQEFFLIVKYLTVYSSQKYCSYKENDAICGQIIALPIVFAENTLQVEDTVVFDTFTDGMIHQCVYIIS